jgi:hypothetical protein
MQGNFSKYIDRQILFAGIYPLFYIITQDEKVSNSGYFRLSG